ncbi:MAG TPA: beta-phosphoglucomutase family hydrolase [Candidatus Sulfopaludibacter sp.]|nr:beta-phosphoglucomutase family hydrolase [Candidatus Sulfopaludibacter sp.]
MALIFDMDGVLIDSNPAHREAWVAYNRSFGLETTDAMHQRMYGKRNDQIIRDFFGDDLNPAEVAARGAAKEQLYRQMIDDRVHEMLVPGLRAFLELHADVPKAIATNAEPANVDFLLDRADLRRYFQAVVDGHQVSNPKPHPEIYLRAAELLGVSPSHCVVLEDSYSGVAAGLAAGMKVIGLRTTYDNLPGTTLTVDNFESGVLTEWLTAQRRAV